MKRTCLFGGLIAATVMMSSCRTTYYGESTANFPVVRERFCKRIITGVALLLALCFKAGAGEVQQVISISPITLFGLATALPEARGPQDFIWVGIDYSMLLEGNKELGFGGYAQPNSYGMRVQYRAYTQDGHKGFFYGPYARLEYRQMGWTHIDNGIQVTDTWLGNGVEGTAFHSVGVTTGYDIGFRWAGRRWGAALFGGAGLPLFYCFGNIPAQEELFSFYGSNIFPRMFDIGLKVDFYL